MASDAKSQLAAGAAEPAPRPPVVPQFGTVLCAVDNSARARAVLYAASGLAAHPKSKLIVIRVDDRAAGSQDQVLAARLQLNEFARSTIPGWLAYRENTEFIIRGGDPAKTILAAARANDAALIVTGTHGRGLIGRTLLGSVTDRVLREAWVPLAVVPASDTEIVSLTETDAVPHFGRILVPVDVHMGAARQIAFASRLATASEYEVLLLHVVPPGGDCHGPLRKLQEMMPYIDTTHGVKAAVKEGPLIETILHVQRNEGAGVIVMGRDAVAPGRLAQDLLHRTSAVVVLVP